MIKAYNQEELDKLEALKEAKKLYSKKLLGEEQFEAAKEKLSTALFTPNFFIRAGLFFFTIILSISGTGLASLYFISGNLQERNIGFISLFFGLIHLFILEHFIRNKKYYKAGIDDCLLYISLIMILTGAFMAFEIEFSIKNLSLLCFPVLLLAAIRYADNLVLTAAFGFLLSFLFSICISNPTLKLLLPFITMAFAGAVYFSIKRLIKEKNRYWNTCLNTGKILTLLTFYAAGNYFIVREGNAMLSENKFDYSHNSNYVELQEESRMIDQELSRLYAERNNYYNSENSSAERLQQIDQNIAIFEDKRREIGLETSAIIIAENEKQSESSVPFSFLFLAFTLLVPALYIVLGLKNKNRVLLVVGMIILAVGVLTFKYYYSIAPPEISLTIAGVVLLFLSYLSIRYLRKNNSVFSYKEEDAETLLAGMEAESLVIAQSFTPSASPPEKGLEFGGGEFGGGGAGGKY